MRAIDASKFLKVSPPVEFGPASQLQWLPIASLVVDDLYQRPIALQGEKTVKSIITRFDWRMFAPVIVSPIAGGLYAIVDGQHRTTAALACGHETVPCAVIMADRQTQATAFGAINGVVTQVSRHQQFKAALAAGDKEALQIKAVADAADVTILFFNTAGVNMKPRETCALDAIRKAIEQQGPSLTTLALRAVAASAGEMEGYLKAGIIKAVCEVLYDHREWATHADLMTAFEEIDLEVLRADAAAKAAQRRGLTTSDLLQASIVKHLDDHLKTSAAGPSAMLEGRA